MKMKKKLLIMIFFIAISYVNVYAAEDRFKIYDELNKNAVLDNISSTYVSSDSGINFSLPSSDTNGKGLYILNSTKDAENKVIYYRGNIENNFIIYENFCWQIIRTTEDGKVKLIYAGTPTDNTCQATGEGMWALENKVKFNNADTVDNVGYMMPDEDGNINAVDSVIKTEVDKWFETNLSGSIDKFSDTIFCNDREFDAAANHHSGWKRIQDGTPDYKCHNIDDSFSTTNIGNGKLKYPVGLITSDEVLYAGGQYHEVDPNNYYNSWALIDVAYWSMTPQSVSKMLYPNSKGYINRNNMTATSGVRPVVAIDGETMLTGDGTRNNPYRVPIDVNYTVETDDYLESDVEVAIEDQTVNITIKGKKGYDFVKFRFYDENGEEKNIAVEGDRKAAHFQMPNYNIRVESVWQKRANPETSTQSNKLGLLLLLISISNIVVITKKIICKQ